MPAMENIVAAWSIIPTVPTHKIYSSGGHRLTPDEMSELLAGSGNYDRASAAYAVTFSGDYSFLGLNDVPGADQYSTNPSAFEWEYMYFKLNTG